MVNNRHYSYNILTLITPSSYIPLTHVHGITCSPWILIGILRPLLILLSLLFSFLFTEEGAVHLGVQL